jgi:hypothetical protein
MPGWRGGESWAPGIKEVAESKGTTLTTIKESKGSMNKSAPKEEQITRTRMMMNYEPGKVNSMLVGLD